MLKKNIIKGIVVILLLTLSFTIVTINKVEAAGTVSISSSKTSVEEGDTFTITVSSSLIGRVNISAGSNITLATNKLWIEKDSQTITGTAKSAGTVTITAIPENGKMSNGDEDVDVPASSCEVTVTAKQTTPAPEPTPDPKPDPEPTFTSVNETVYVKSTGSINVRASWSTSSKVVGSLKNGDTITRTGKSSNGWSRVSYNGTTAYISSSLLTTEKPQEKPEENPPQEPTTTKSNNTNLKSLTLKVEGLTPNFSTDVTNYTLVIESKVAKLEIAAVAEDTKSNVKIEGNTSMVEGENKITVTVTAEDGTTKTYTIKVANGKTEQLTGENNGLQLKKLEIKGVNIGEVFSPSVYEYKINVKDISSLEITAEANEEGATVEILGNKDFKEGENIITIMLKSKDGEETATYQIIVNKTAIVGQTENDNWKMFAMIGGGIILLFAIVAGIAFIIIKRKDKNENYYEEEEENGFYEDKFAKFEEPEENLFQEEEPREEKTIKNNWFEEENEEEETDNRRRKGKHF